MFNKNVITRLLLLFYIFTLPAYGEVKGIENLRNTSKAFATVARTVSPSVVLVEVESSRASTSRQQYSNPFDRRGPLDDELLKRFFGDRFPGFQQAPRQGTPQPRQRMMGQGSGFIYKVESSLLAEKTYILTNNHVVEHAEKIRVKFENGNEYDAKITGTDPKSDVAVIEIKTNDTPALAMGDSTKLDVGEWVVAIGNPFGLSHTLTVGVVSAKGRTAVGINDYEDFIQTDAAINPGNSGGPLVNLNGEVIGMNTAIFSRSGGSMGIGFAIPVNLAKSIAEQLIESGKVVRGHLGVVIQPLTPELADSFGMNSVQGILVAQVEIDSPAEKASLVQGDVIISYRGEKIDSIGQFRNQVALTTPNSAEKLTVMRNGKRKMLTVIIGQQDDKLQIASHRSESASEIGMVVQTITPEQAKQFNIRPGVGVVVTEVEPFSVAARAGIKTGTIIFQVNRKAVHDVTEFELIIKDSRIKKSVMLLVLNSGYQHFIVLNW